MAKKTKREKPKFSSYNKAIKYLKEIGQLDAIERELSTDGWTVIALANDFYEHNNKKPLS